MSEDGGNFLSRWSRRKLESRRAAVEPDAAPAPAVPPAGGAESTLPAGAAGGGVPGAMPDLPPAQLPPVDELHGLASEYRDFLRPEVDESLRRTALKKLFHDPHFNTMDGLDTYIDDYTKADPIPEAMLKALNQAQGLVFDREDEQADHVDQVAPAVARAEAQPQEPGTVPEPPDQAAVPPPAKPA